MSGPAHLCVVRGGLGRAQWFKNHTGWPAAQPCRHRHTLDVDTQDLYNSDSTDLRRLWVVSTLWSFDQWQLGIDFF